MKSILYQTDCRLDKWFNDYGCLLVCLATIAQLDKLHFFSPKELLDLKAKAKDKGWIGPVDENGDGVVSGREAITLYVKKPDEIIAEAWRMTGGEGKPVRQIGSKNLETGEMGWGTAQGARFSILKGAGHSLFHFRVGNAAGAELFDPRPFTEITKEVRIDYYG